MVVCLSSLVTVAIAISYFDRQTLPVAIAAIQRNIPISDQQFSYLQTAFLLSYAALYIGGGRLLDVLGTRRGFMLIMLWWSIACALHGFASGFGLLLCARFLLGMGEGGGFPAAIRVVAEWISPEHRSTAMGIINAGTAVGSVLAPPLIGFVLLHSGWRMVFYLAGAVGMAWVLWWALQRTADSSSQCIERSVAPRLELAKLFSIRTVQALVFAKFMSDSAWYFLLFWLAQVSVRRTPLRYQTGQLLCMDSVRCLRHRELSGRVFFQQSSAPRDEHLDKARKMALGLSAAFMPVVMLVPLVPVHYALALIQHCVLLPAVVVRVGDDGARRHLAAFCGGHGLRLRRFWRGDWGSDVRSDSRLSASAWFRLSDALHTCGQLSSHRLPGDRLCRRQNSTIDRS